MRCPSFLRLHPLAIVAVAAMAAAGSANAVDLYGGGATFPIISYVGDDYLDADDVPEARLSRNVTTPSVPAPVATLTPPNTVFARFSTGTGHRISYCQTGSGTGKTILIGVGSIINANGYCGAYQPSVSPAGFSAPTAVPNYIGTDSPISQADATSFSGGPRAARGLWQIPTLAGSIALPRHAGLNFPNLTTAHVCGIFSARIINWSQIPGSGSTAPIHVVYRSEGSGTSFAFTSYLATACNGQTFSLPSGSITIPAGYFKPNQSFAAAVPAVPGQPGSVAPFYAGSTALTGNPGVVNGAISTANAIGYADYPEVAAQGAEFPTVNGQNPAALPASLNISDTNLLSGQVLNASNTPVPVTGLPNASCLRLISPSTIPAGVAYPILAYTYLAGYRNGNGTGTAALRSLLGYFLSTAPAPGRPTPPAGFAYLDGSTAYRTSVQNTINTCIL